MANISWSGSSNIGSTSYDCGHCGNSIATQVGYVGTVGNTLYARIYVCHKCTKPTIFVEGEQIPGAHFGQSVSHIPDANIEKLYEEARACFSVNAYTSSVMSCRKLLMNIAVSEGAEEGKSFVFYVDYLNDQNFIPPKGRDWVDAIRKLGNEANHSIEFKTAEEAKLILTFTQMFAEKTELYEKWQSESKSLFD